MAGRTVGQGRGSVYAGGSIYLEGDTIPSDVQVGDHVFTDVDDAGTLPSAPRAADDLVDGNIDEVLERVGDDVDKARAALAAEEAAPKPRATLIEKLQSIVNGAT